MKLFLDNKLGDAYVSQSQKIRVMTESWVHDSIYCPNCGQDKIKNFTNNKPVADFYCQNCNEEYELKSKQKSIGTKIVDGAYTTMVERLQSNSNPNFFFLSYSLSNYAIKNFIVIPKHFFIPKIIEKRKPLALTAKRAGWVGCNILLKSIPQTGKIFYVHDGNVVSKEDVTSQWNKTLFLREQSKISGRGWILDVMRIIEKINKTEFTLDELYEFENELQKLHPENNHIKDKIRQQVQVLRDKDYLEFINRGQYRLI